MFRREKLLSVLLALCLLIGSGVSAFAEELTDPLAQEPAEIQPEIVLNTDADLRVGYVAASGAPVNPFMCTERDLVSLNQLVFESLVDLDDQLKPSPELADSWSVDGKVWTFKLRSGIVFHNGEPLTAWDVVSSYERFLAAGSSNFYYGRLSLIASMEAVDDLTLTVTSNYSGYITLYAMTFPVVQSATQADSLPRGTGPYWYTQFNSDVGLRVERNPLWWKNDPKIETLAAIRFNESGDALEALQTNQINLLSTQSSSASLSRRLSNLTSLDYMTSVYEYLLPNLSESSLMGDVRMRQAVMYAIDRATLVSNAYLGMGIQCEVPINPASWLYESQSAIYYYSPERALKLIQECGWKDLTGDGMLDKLDGVRIYSLEMTLVTYNEPAGSIRENAAKLIAAYLEKVGVKVNVKVLSRENAAKAIKDKNYDLALIGVNLSEVPNLSQMLHSGGSLNLNNYANDDMDARIVSTANAATEEEMKSIYSEIQMSLVDRLPIMGMLFRSGTVLSSRTLAGLKGTRAGDTLRGIEFMEQ